MKKVFNDSLFICYTVLLCIIGLTPIANSIIPTVIRLAIWVGYVVLYWNGICKYCDSGLIKARNHWFVYLAITFIYILLGISQWTSKGVIITATFIVPFLAFILMYAKCDELQLRILFHIFCIIIAFNIADGIRICMMYPQVAYQSLSEELELFGMEGLNLGKAGFMNMTVFFLNVVLIAFFNTNRKIEKMLFLGYAALTVLFDVVYTLKASIALFSILSVLLQYIAFKATNFKRALWLSLMGFFLVYFFKDAILHFVVDISGSDRLAIRLLALSSDAADEGDISTFSGRSELWLVSLQTWLRNPITFLFGIGNRVVLEGQSAAFTGIGNHSDLCDTLARYGIIGTGFVCSFFGGSFKYLKTIVKNVNPLIAFFTLIVGFAVSKTIFAVEEAFIILCLFPLCMVIYNKQ